MMTKTILHSWVAIAIGCAALLATSSCSDDNLASNSSVNPYTPVDLNVDQLQTKVTADVPTAVLSSFDEQSMGAALVRRLSNTSTSVQSDTKMILIKGEDIKSHTTLEWLQAARLYMRGGYIAVEKPHDAHLVEVGEQVSAQLEQASRDLLTDDDGSGIKIVITPPNQQQSLGNSVNAEAERFKTRIANAEALSSKASSGEKPVAEMVIFSRQGFYQCAPHEERTITTTMTKKDGTTSTSTQTIKNEYNNYTSGKLADGAAEWLNNHAPGKADSKSRLQSKAEGTDAINQLMSASEEHTYQGGLTGGVVYLDKYGDHDFDLKAKPNAYQEIIRVWGVHNMEKVKDYYLVEQHAVASIGGKQDGDARYDANKTIYVGPYEENKWEGVTYDDLWRTFDWSTTDFYGSWFERGEYSMNLSGNGDIIVEDAAPDTDNNNVSRTVAVGESSSQTNTIGASVGAMIGQVVSGTFNVNYSHGWTTGTSYTVSWTDNVKELKCTKNTDGTKVGWTYENSRDMMQGDGDEHVLVADILTNDVNIDNQVCWSVSNPSDAYTVNIHHPCYTALLSYQNGNGGPDEKRKFDVRANCDMDENVSFTMLIPNRAKQTWRMDVDFPELGQEGHIGQRDQLIDYLTSKFPDVYQSSMELADHTINSENTIMYVVDASKQMLTDPNALQDLQRTAQDYGISEFTIKWYTSDGTHSTYTLTIPAK